MRRQARRVTTAVAAGGLLAGGLTAIAVTAAAPAQANAPLLACSWIEAVGSDNRDNTTVCRGPGKKATVIIQRDCWKLQPPSNAFVRVKRGPKWVTSDAQVTIRQAKSCPETHPWLTLVRIPTKGMKPYQTQSFRLILPEHEIDVDDTVRTVKQFRLSIFACMIRDNSNRLCP